MYVREMIIISKLLIGVTIVILDFGIKLNGGEATLS